MKNINKLFPTLLLLFATAGNLIYAQGFNWQWSARLPFEISRNYWGISAKFGLQYAVGNISFLENKIQCVDYVDGNGNDISLGATFEHWEKYNRFAYRAGLQYKNNSISSYSIDYVPLNSAITAEYRNELAINFSEINLNIGAKYRILNTHFNIGTDIIASYIFEKTFNVTEEILGPPEVPPFTTNPPSYKRDILNGEIASMHYFQIKPAISIGYDMQLGRGTYFEPNISFTIPTFSMFKGTNVHNYITSLGINFYRKI
jgi:hypothetical protein